MTTHVRLAWKSRTTKLQRGAALKVVRAVYPDASDDGQGIAFSVEGKDARSCWLYLAGSRTYFRAIETVDEVAA